MKIIMPSIPPTVPVGVPTLSLANLFRGLIPLRRQLSADPLKNLKKARWR